MKELAQDVGTPHCPFFIAGTCLLGSCFFQVLGDQGPQFTQQ